MNDDQGARTAAAGLSRRTMVKAMGLGASATAMGFPAVVVRDLLGATGAGAAGSNVPDAWSPLMWFRAPGGGYAAPIHVSLMPSGELIYMGGSRPTPESSGGSIFARNAFTMRPNGLNEPFPGQILGTPWLEPVQIDAQRVGSWVISENLFCGGHSLTADGRFFTVGGTQSAANVDTLEYQFTGLPYATIYDGTTWRRVTANMVGKRPGGQPRRWYPTVTRMTDGRMLVISGSDRLAPTNSVNLTAETFDPTTESWTLTSAFGATPLEMWNHDYTHVVVLPKPINGFDLLMFGELGIPVLATSTGPMSWNVRDTKPRPGSEAFQAERLANNNMWIHDEAPNACAPTVVLPFRLNDGEWGYANGSVLITGGPMESTFSENIDVYDPVADSWRPSFNTGVFRHCAAAVVLPDSRVLIVGGAGPEPETHHAGYVDPAHGFSFATGATTTGEVRAYHGLAILLPDGRVLTGGGRGSDNLAYTEKTNMRYYYPPYMFVPRPAITAAPTQLSLNTSFAVQTSGKKPAEVVLMALGSFTHCFDQNARSVQLQVTSVVGAASSFALSVMAPPDAQTAPPGYYMLFVLDAARIPSVAKIVRLVA